MSGNLVKRKAARTAATVKFAMEFDTVVHDKVKYLNVMEISEYELGKRLEGLNLGYRPESVGGNKGQRYRIVTSLRRTRRLIDYTGTGIDELRLKIRPWLDEHLR